MNKEVIVAIGIGVILGLLGAIYFNNVKTASPSKNKIGSSTAEIVTLAPTKPKLVSTVFSGIPENNSLLKSNKLTIKGTSDNKAVIVLVDNVNVRIIPVKKGQLSETINLKPGLNQIAVSSYDKVQDLLKILNVYYLTPYENKLLITENKKATDEAEILKQKLEKEVLEMRANVSKVFTGKIKQITDKEISLDISSQTKKFKLEPEITKFYLIKDLTLESLELSDFAKSDLVTIFLSNIAGEEKCYTVYKEPDITLVAGKISNLDKSNYKITMINYDKTTLSSDIEINSTQEFYDLKSKALQKGGFSKLLIGDHIFALIYTNKGGTYSFSEYLALHPASPEEDIKGEQDEKITPTKASKITPTKKLTIVPTKKSN